MIDFGRHTIQDQNTVYHDQHDMGLPQGDAAKKFFGSDFAHWFEKEKRFWDV